MASTPLSPVALGCAHLWAYAINAAGGGANYSHGHFKSQ
jgi:hypothetical protein